MKAFEQLVKSRREWIDTVLIPWCRSADRRSLLLAEQEWSDLAGRPDPEHTLWSWAWQRHDQLSTEQIGAINESFQVRVECHDGRTGEGFPDAKRSIGGLLILVTETGQLAGPFEIDEIKTITRIDFEPVE